MSVNKVLLLGNVGKQPEVRNSNGVKVVTFSLATTDKAYIKQDGTQVPERTEWHNIVMFKRNAEVAERYINKGTRLYIEGKLRTRDYESNGIKKYVTEVICDYFEMLGGGQRNEAPAPQAQQYQQPYQQQAYQPQYQQPQYQPAPQPAPMPAPTPMPTYQAQPQPQAYAPQPQPAPQPQVQQPQTQQQAQNAPLGVDDLPFS